MQLCFLYYYVIIIISTTLVKRLININMSHMKKTKSSSKMMKTKMGMKSKK